MKTMAMIQAMVRRMGVSAAQRTPSRLPSRYTNGLARTLAMALTGVTLFHAVATASGPGTTTGELLKIPVGARAIGMGEAFTGLANDASSIEWNPAGMTTLQQKEATFMHSSLIEGVHYEHMSFVSPGSNYSVGGAISYLGYGDIAGYDNSGDPTGSVKAYSYKATGALARQIRNNLSLGVSLSLLRETLADTSAGTVALGAGALYSVPSHVFGADYKLGASLLNLGPGLKFVSERDPLPRKIKFGASATHFKGLPLAFTTDVTVPNDNSAYLSLGSEYWFKDMLALRVGYMGSNDEGKGVRLGFGLKYSEFQFDYAYGGFGDFGATHRVGVAWRFGERVEQLNAEERAILREANAARHNGQFVDAIMLYNKILDTRPNNDQVRKTMIETHEAMLRGELNDAIAQTPGSDAKADTIAKDIQTLPSADQFGLADLMPGQAPLAMQKSHLANPAFDPLGLEGLPDVDNLDSALTSTKKTPVTQQAAPNAPALIENPNPLPQPKADEATVTPEPSAPVSNDATPLNNTALDPSDIYGN